MRPVWIGVGVQRIQGETIIRCGKHVPDLVVAKRDPNGYFRDPSWRTDETITKNDIGSRKRNHRNIRPSNKVQNAFFLVVRVECQQDRARFRMALFPHCSLPAPRALHQTQPLIAKTGGIEMISERHGALPLHPAWQRERFQPFQLGRQMRRAEPRRDLGIGFAMGRRGSVRFRK